MKKKELKQYISQLQWAEDRRLAQKHARETEWLQDLEKSIGPAKLLLPSGSVLPVVISNCAMHREHSEAMFDVTMTVRPLPPE